jgi:RNA polymerase sigma-70 factor (ECF subfamily)
MGIYGGTLTRRRPTYRGDGAEIVIVPRDIDPSTRAPSTTHAKESVLLRKAKAEGSDCQPADDGGGTPTDETLVTRALEGDRSAAAELVGRYHQKAYGIAYHLCSGDTEEARDFTQEAFLRAFANLGTFRGRSSFYTWFYRILVNTCRDGRRRVWRWKRRFAFWRSTPEDGATERSTPENHPDQAQHADPAAVLTGKELRERLRKAMLSLPRKQRTAFQLKVFHGMTIHEIAKVMNTAEGTVKSHLFRATQQLREALSDWATPGGRS